MKNGMDSPSNYLLWVLKNGPINAILISIYVALYSPNYDLQGTMAL
jgi:hypothetical protein